MIDETMDTSRIEREVKRLLAIEGLQEMDKAYRALAAGEGEEVYFILLELLRSGEVLHVMKAAKFLAKKGNPKYLPEMREIRKNLPPRKGLADYRRSVDKAIMLLEMREEGKACNCDFYALSTGFSNMSNPFEEENEGNITIVEQIVHHESYYSDYFCICNTCGRGWQVQDEIGYHYPLYQWTEITFTPAYEEYHGKYLEGVKGKNTDLDD